MKMRIAEYANNLKTRNSECDICKNGDKICGYCRHMNKSGETVCHNCGEFLEKKYYYWGQYCKSIQNKYDE